MQQYYEVIYFKDGEVFNKHFERKTEATSYARKSSKDTGKRVQIFKTEVDTLVTNSVHVAFYKDGKKVNK